ncbi:unnamed protein product [Urochloa humidicola]
MEAHQRRQQQQQQQDAEAPDDPGAGDPLLARDQQPPVVADAWWSGVPWLTILGFLFLTLNSLMAIHRSQGERSTVAFVVFSYLDLVVLFICLKWYENALPDSVTRAWLKVAVWILTTALTLLFSAKVAVVMPAAVAVVVWLMAFATVAGGFYAFFCYSEKE